MIMPVKCYQKEHLAKFGELGVAGQKVSSRGQQNSVILKPEDLPSMTVLIEVVDS